MAKDTRTRVRNTAPWRKAEFQVTNMLRHRGVSCKSVGSQNRPYDVITKAGQRIEVKFARLSKKHQWHCNLTPVQWAADWLILVLSGLPSAKCDQASLYVVMRPVRKRAIRLTVRSLLNRFAKDVGAWKRIVRVEKRRADERRCLRKRGVGSRSR